MTGTSDRDWVDVTGTSLTIEDDDILTQVTGVTAEQIAGGVDADAGDARIGWNKAAGATGYVVQWKSGAQTYDSTLATRSVTVGDVATVQIDRANFTQGTTYTFRVYAVKTGFDDGAPSADVTLGHKGWMIFDKTSLSVVEPTTGTATGNYTVKLGSQPTGDVTLILSRGAGSTAATPFNPTFSPSTLTFTSADWSTPKPVTVTVATDTDGVDDVTVIEHTASSTDADYDGASGAVTATEDDNNKAPTSANFTRYVLSRASSSAATSLRVSLYFPFTDTDTPPDSLNAVHVESLPDSSQGTLKFYQRKVGPRRNVTSAVNVGDRAFSIPGSPSARAKVLRFYPEAGFTSTTFTFRVEDDSGNLSDGTYTITLLLKESAPSSPRTSRPRRATSGSL